MANDAASLAELRTFNRWQRDAIKRLALIDEPRCNMPGVGQGTLDQLKVWGIIEESGVHRHGEPTYRLTPEGNRIYEGLWKYNLFPK